MVDINQSSETTPFSNQPISKISSNDWSKMSRSELEEQRYKLQMRMQVALQINNTVMISTIQNGIDRITQMINNLQGKI